jgi:hypothetical protein
MDCRSASFVEHRRDQIEHDPTIQERAGAKDCRNLATALEADIGLPEAFGAAAIQLR